MNLAPPSRSHDQSCDVEEQTAGVTICTSLFDYRYLNKQSVNENTNNMPKQA